MQVYDLFGIWFLAEVISQKPEYKYITLFVASIFKLYWGDSLPRALPMGTSSTQSATMALGKSLPLALKACLYWMKSVSH